MMDFRLRTQEQVWKHSLLEMLAVMAWDIANDLDRCSTSEGTN